MQTTIQHNHFQVNVPVLNRSYIPAPGSMYASPPFNLCSLYVTLGYGFDTYDGMMATMTHLKEKYVSECGEGYDFKEPLWFVMYDILYLLRDLQFRVKEICIENGGESVEFKD